MIPTGTVRRYAQALVQVATKDGDARRVAAELDGFAELMKQSLELRTVLANPAVAREEKHAVVEHLIARLGYSLTLRNFLFVLVDHRRAELLPLIQQEFRRQLDEALGIVAIEVRSAHELSQAERERLDDALGRLTRHKVELQFERDPELLGGVIARIGSTIYDGSLRDQLRRIQEQLSSE